MNVAQIALVIAFASFIRVLSGFGSGTIMVSILSLFQPFDQTVLLSSIIHWFTNVLVLIFFWHGINIRLFLYFGIPGALASIAGSYVLSHTSPEWLLPWLGFVLIVYAIYVLIRPAFHVKRTPLLVMIAGATSGLSKGLFGVGGGVRSMTLSAFNISKKAYLTTGAALSFFIDTVRLIAYYAYGLRLASYLNRGLLLFVPAAFAGAYIARFFVKYISEEHFRILVMIFLCIMGIRLIFYAV